MITLVRIFIALLGATALLASTVISPVLAQNTVLSGEWAMINQDTKESFTLTLSVSDKAKKGYGKHFAYGKWTYFTFMPVKKIEFVIGSLADSRMQGRYLVQLEGTSLKGNYSPQIKRKDAPKTYKVSGSKN